MAKVCTPTLEGVNSISTHPINLSLLTKKRLMEEDDLYESNPEHNCSSKRPKTDDGSENEDKQEELVVHDNKSEDYPAEHTDNDKSKSSILQHYYSFTRRKTDDTNPTNQPLQEIASGRERPVLPPVSLQQMPDAGSEKLRQNALHHMIAPENKLLDYNAFISRQIAARGGTPTIVDLWNAMTASALVRAKNNYKEHHRTSPTYPTFPTMNNDYEQTNKLPNTTSTTAIPERTMRQNNWAVKVRRRDKRPYPPDTLMQIASGLQRHLRHVSGRSDITFFDKYSPTFAEFREALKARSDVINSKLSNTRRDGNSGLSPHSSDGGMSDQWPTSLFNLSTAKGLFRAVFYTNCVTFHITSMEEHHSLQVSQYRVGIDGKSGQEYVEFTRENGEVTRKLSSPYDPRCVVKIFKKYFECIPLSGVLYKRPLQSTDGADLRFSFNPVGINKLRETFKILFGGRRSGVHIPTADDDEENDGHAPHFRHHSAEDDPRQYHKYVHSPISNASSRVSIQDEDSGEEGGKQHSPADQRTQSSPRTVITYAADVREDATKRASMAASNLPMYTENNNNNAVKVEDEDCLTLKVPAYVKSVVILQNGNRYCVDLTETRRL